MMSLFPVVTKELGVNDSLSVSIPKVRLLGRPICMKKMAEQNYKSDNVFSN